MKREGSRRWMLMQARKNNANNIRLDLCCEKKKKKKVGKILRPHTIKRRADRIRQQIWQIIVTAQQSAESHVKSLSRQKCTRLFVWHGGICVCLCVCVCVCVCAQQQQNMKKGSCSLAWQTVTHRCAVIHVQRAPGIFERQAKEFITRCLILDTDAPEKFVSSYKTCFFVII